MKPPFLQSDAFTATGVLRHGFFGREGGVSTGDFASLNMSFAAGDDPASVEANRRLAADALGGDTLVVLRQVHSNRVITVEAGALPDATVEADALVTRRADILLGILTADCAPLLFVDHHAGIIGAAHAGWKGAVTGIIEQTLLAMEAIGAQRRRVSVVLGPTISGQNYEVGPDFMGAAIAQNPAAAASFFTPEGGREHFDLPDFLRRDAAQAGVTEFTDLGQCTYAHPDRFFSHRYATHQASKAGRQLAVIGLV